MFCVGYFFLAFAYFFLFKRVCTIYVYVDVCLCSVAYILPFCLHLSLLICSSMRTRLSRCLHHSSLLICVSVYVYVYAFRPRPFSFASLSPHLCIYVYRCLYCMSVSSESLVFLTPHLCTCVCMCTYVCFVKGAYLLSSRPHTSLSSCFFSLLPRGQTSLPHKPLRVRYLRTIFNSNCIFVQV